MKVAVIQMTSVSDVGANIAKATTLMERAIGEDGADWLCLPECWNWAGGSVRDKAENADIIPGGQAYLAAQELAAKHRVWVHAGSLVERAVGKDGQANGMVHNTTVVFNRLGDEVARYRKIHLFDIVLSDGTEYKESSYVVPGRDVVTYDCEGITVGCAICYDLRFPDLFQALMDKGADLIALASAFTLQTGKDHWEPLCRARAIETETYFAAPGQTGSFRDGDNQRRYTYGHSLVVDPWGHVIAKVSDGEGYVVARIDRGLLERVRRQIPVASHRVLGRSH